MKTIPDEYKIKAPFDCTLSSQLPDRFVLTDSTRRSFTYPAAANLRFMEGSGPNKNKYSKGELMAQVVSPLPPTLKLEMVIKLIGANSCLSGNRMTRADVTEADSYTIEGGTIHYDFDKKKVKIGSEEYDLTDNAAYYYADGENLKPMTKFRSGIMTPVRIFRNGLKVTPENIEKAYLIFRDQIWTINGKDSINEELMEVMFRSCLVNGKFMRVDAAIENTSSVLASISYGRAGRSIAEVINEPKSVSDDPMSNVLLNFMMHDAASNTLLS